MLYQDKCALKIYSVIPTSIKCQINSIHMNKKQVNDLDIIS